MEQVFYCDSFYSERYWDIMRKENKRKFPVGDGGDSRKRERSGNKYYEELRNIRNYGDCNLIIKVYPKQPTSR